MILYRLTFYDEDIQQSIVVYYEDYDYAFGEHQNRGGSLEQVDVQERGSILLFT